MEYKVGDKVKLNRSHVWDKGVLTEFDKLPDRVATIKKIDENDQYYYMEEIDWAWRDSEVECLVVRKPIKTEEEPIESRWEILDIRK